MQWFHCDIVFGCADLFFCFVSSCLVFFLVYLFHLFYFYFLEGGGQITTSRGSDNLVSFHLLKMST